MADLVPPLAVGAADLFDIYCRLAYAGHAATAILGVLKRSVNEINLQTWCK